MMPLLAHILLNLVALSCFATVYGANEKECDGDPTTGAFGPMSTYPRVVALTVDAQRELGVQPGQAVLVLCTELELCGLYNFFDRMPGRGRRIDLNVEGSNWSGDAVTIAIRRGHNE